MFVSSTKWFKRHWWMIKEGAFWAFHLAFFGGWVANLVKVIEADFDTSDHRIAARVIGIVIIHIGAILGYV